MIVMKLENKPTTAKWLFPLAIILAFAVSCQKQLKQSDEQAEGFVSAAKLNKEHGHLKQTKTFPADVVIQWLNMQLDMLRVPLAAGTGSQAANRAMAYCGIAAYESVVPGMPAYQTLTGQLNGFPEMPSTEPGKAYHWAASIGGPAGVAPAGTHRRGARC
jgi:hypothetical protein